MLVTFFRYTSGELRQFPLNSVSKTINDNRPKQKDKDAEDKVMFFFFFIFINGVKKYWSKRTKNLQKLGMTKFQLEMQKFLIFSVMFYLNLWNIRTFNEHLMRT